MITFFGIVVVVGFLWLLLENAAKHGSPAPSMHGTSGNGWVLVAIGIIGVLCAGLMP